MEKLIYLVWDRPSRRGADVRAQVIDDVAPRLLALGPHGLQIDVDDDEADFSSMVPVPDDELPVRAGVSIWVDAPSSARTTNASSSTKPPSSPNFRTGVSAPG